MKKHILYIFLLISAISFAQNPMVKAQIETSQIRIGEQFSYRISVNETDNVILPKLELKGLEVIDSAKVDTLNNMLIQKYIITGFDSGAYYIPQQQVYVKNQAYLAKYGKLRPIVESELTSADLKRKAILGPFFFFKNKVNTYKKNKQKSK